MITIKVPDYCKEEIHYTIDLIMSVFWGIEYNITNTQEDMFRIVLESGSIVFPCIFFQKYNALGVNSSLIPVVPLDKMHLDENRIFSELNIGEIPVIFGSGGEKGEYLLQQDNIINIGIDLFGSIFFMLTRFEEYLDGNRDRYDRYPATESMAYRAGFLDRPLVNEYLEILWTLMQYLSPGLPRKHREFSMQPSHDVDVPFFLHGRRFTRIIQDALAELAIRRRAKVIPSLLLGAIKTRFSGYTHDPYYTFDYIMVQSEKRGLKSTFYFISDNSNGEIDCTYKIDDIEMKKLLQAISTRGHNIGLHASYYSFKDKNRITGEQKRLRDVVEGIGIKQDTWGVRQHYLRFIIPDTFRHQEAAGLDYDATLGYAETPGFRCGTCFEFPVFDLHEKRKLNIVERPLIAMDASLLLSRYTGGERPDILGRFVTYKNICKRYNGAFTLLWHNSHLAYKEEKSCYEAVLDA